MMLGYLCTFSKPVVIPAMAGVAPPHRKVAVNQTRRSQQVGNTKDRRTAELIEIQTPFLTDLMSKRLI